MSIGTALRVAGHTCVRSDRDGRNGGTAPLPHCPDGSVILGRTSGPGHGRCSCGLVSEECYPGAAARERWHTRHKEELAGVPWSDAAIAARYG